MNNFDSLFPNFTARCADLQSVLMPVAYLLLVTGMVSSRLPVAAAQGLSCEHSPHHRLHHRAHAVGELGQSDCPDYRQHG